MNRQSLIERQREKYSLLPKPLLGYLAEIHGLSVRKFASIFGISKTQASDILSHKILPSLDLAVRISRYFDTTVEDLFGWRVDDNGDRRPLVISLDGKNYVVATLPRTFFKKDSVSFVGKICEAIESGEYEELKMRVAGK